MFNIVKTGLLITIHVFSRRRKIDFFSEVLLKLSKIFDSDYVTYNIVRTGPCFPGFSVSQESEWLLFSPCAYFPGPAWRVKSSQ